MSSQGAARSIDEIPIGEDEFLEVGLEGEFQLGFGGLLGNLQAFGFWDVVVNRYPLARVLCRIK